jgi:3',5'-cyclic AMP phosphodiesterase CpdA
MIFSEIGLIRPDFVLWTGDVVYGYGDSTRELSVEYDRFAKAARTCGVPFFNAPGNHEIHHRTGEPCGDHASEAEFVRQFGNLYGSFDAGGAHFIALDTAQVCSEDRLDAQQLAWLENDLEANKNARAIFVFSHTEFFTSPTIDEDDGRFHPEIQGKAELIALFRRYPVRAVFSGHEHLYSHETHDGIDYFIAGGGGAPLYAPPERGGFSHYVLVRLSAGAIRYDVIEPGHLYVERGPDLVGKSSTWVVNANDLDVPLRGATIEVPAGTGPCSRLVVESELRRLDAAPIPIPIETTACVRANGKRRLTLSLTVPRGRSLPITVRNKK